MGRLYERVRRDVGASAKTYGPAPHICKAARVPGAAGPLSTERLINKGSEELQMTQAQ